MKDRALSICRNKRCPQRGGLGKACGRMCSVQRPEGTEKGCGGRAGGSHRELSWSPWCGSPWTRGRTGHSHRGNVMEVGGLKQRCGMSDLCGVCVVLCECVRIPFCLKADSCALVWKDYTWFIVHSSVDTGWAASPLGYSPQVCTHLFGALFSALGMPPHKRSDAHLSCR